MEPHFIIVGAMKAGTTSLYAYLAQHPAVIGTRQDEVHFFDLNYDRGWDWYLAHFPLRHVRRGVITGEASPYYMFHPHAMERIARELPSVRIVVLLRNPVDRAFSHYQHEVAKGRETESFERALALEDARVESELDAMRADEAYDVEAVRRFSYRRRGEYAEQLERIFDLFPRRQICIVQSKRFFTDTETVYRNACRFIGVDADVRSPEFRPYNARTYTPMKSSTREELAEHYRPHNRRLYGLIGETFSW